MRAALVLLSFALSSFSLSAQTQENKPHLIVYASAHRDDFERITLVHPTIARRLAHVTITVEPPAEGADESIAFFDRGGTLRARWPMVPDTMQLGMIIDSVVAVAPHFERAVELAEAGSHDAGDLEAAIGLAKLTRFTAAREALSRARESDNREIRQSALVLGAVLDANEGKRAQALAALEAIAADPATPKIAADAKQAIETIRPSKGVVAEPAAIRILPLAHQVVSGRHLVKTQVSSAAIGYVTFSLDHREIARIRRPPFAATLDFGSIPQRHAIGVVAFDRKGKEVARDERVVNEGGESFWLRLVTPREGPAAGDVGVAMDVRVPVSHLVRRVVVNWNGAQRAVLTAPPWMTAVNIRAHETGVLGVVAELDDGRFTEDAVLLNGGASAEANVQLVGLPLTIASAADITPRDIVVREGKKTRDVEAIGTSAETPLTVGILIDVSDSMEKTLPDVQEAAIRFVHSILGERDRAFLIAFDTRAHLVQSATSDVAKLEEQIMRLRPAGFTALHDAMVLGLLQFEGIKGRRAMVVFTDGFDVTSSYSTEDVRDLARRANVPIHFIASRTARAGDHAELRRVAIATGGTAHWLRDLASLPTVYAEIEEALRNQLLAYILTEPAKRENEWRAITVTVPGRAVHAPEGYSATW